MYVTASCEAEAKKIGVSLIEKRLAACVNILGPVKSVYRWEDRIEESTEVAMLVKTRKCLFYKAADTIKNEHSYSCPCITAFPVTLVEKQFGEWIMSETTGQ
jgi:periplasmic divalent cation tolerance protein